MKKINVILLVISLLFLICCAESRYMMGSFRTVNKVAPKIKYKKTAIIMHGFTQNGVMNFENDLRTLGYNIVGNSTDCYDQKMKKSFTSDDYFFTSMNCGQEVGAEIVLFVSYSMVNNKEPVKITPDTIYYKLVPTEQITVDIFDADKRKWLVHRDVTMGKNYYTNVNCYDELLKKFK